MIQLTVVLRNKAVIASVPQLFDTETMLDVQAEGTGTGFYHNGAKYKVSESFSAVGALASAVPAGDLPMAVWGVFDTALAANRTIAAHALLDENGAAVTIPAGAIITEAFYIVDTTFTSATDAGTISIGLPTDAVAGLKAATAISVGTTYDALSPIHPVALTPVGTAATMITPLTAARGVDITVAVEALTAGKMRVCIQYTVPTV